MTLEEKYKAALLALLEETKKAIPDYNPSRAINMVRDKTPREAVEAAKTMILSLNATGLKRVQKEGRLDLSIEQHLRDNSEFHPLFGEDIIELCRKILDDLKKITA